MKKYPQPKESIGEPSGRVGKPDKSHYYFIGKEMAEMLKGEYFDLKLIKNNN